MNKGMCEYFISRGCSVLLVAILQLVASVYFSAAAKLTECGSGVVSVVGSCAPVVNMLSQ